MSIIPNNNELNEKKVVYPLKEIEKRKIVEHNDLITSVAQRFQGQFLTADYQPQFTSLKSHDELDNDNYTALINSGTVLGNTMRSLFGE